MPSQEESQSAHSENKASMPDIRIWRIWNPLWKIRNRGKGTLFASCTVFGMLLLLSPYQLTNWVASVREVTAWDPKTLFVLADGTYLDHAIPFVDSGVLHHIRILRCPTLQRS